MSLINDALKRVTQARASAPRPDTNSANDDMEPAERHGSVGLPVYFMPVLLCVVTAACYFLVRIWDGRRQSGLYPEPITVHARQPAPAATDPATVAAATDTHAQPVPGNRQFGVNDAPAPAEPAADETSAFRLQGIFYRPSRPSAVINAQTVYVGDAVGNGRVKAITRDSVTILVNGQTKVLTLH